MEMFLSSLFNQCGKQYEVLIYEKSRRAALIEERDFYDVAVPVDREGDARLARKIELMETLLKTITELREI